MTELARDMGMERQAEIFESANFKIKSVEQGAATQCWAATTPELDGSGGLYLEDCNVAAMDDAPDLAINKGVCSYAVDPQNAQRLWQLSEQMTGFQYPN